jgi:hypothetical protein
MEQEGILLRFVEAVHLINEQNCAPVLRQVLLGKPYGTADFFDATEHCGNTNPLAARG